MKSNRHFQDYQSKLKTEAWLKSILSGLAVGFGANFIASLVFWLAAFDGFYYSLIALAVVTLIAAPLFYVKRFRPTDLSNARRLDRLGLDERLITMVEYEQDDSYIAQVQREDAKQALDQVQREQLKIKLSKAVLASFICLAVLGTAMTTINTLSEYGLIVGGDSIIDSIVEEQTTVYVTVSYVIEEGGYFEGDEEQIIVLGTDATTITAIADEGYMFKGWSDGGSNPTRTDAGIVENVVYIAEFVEVGDGEGDGDGDGDGEGDEPSDAPGEPSDNGESNGEPGDNPPPPDPEGSGEGGGGRHEPNNQVINGEQYYRDLLEQYQDAGNDRVESGDSGLTPEEIAIIKKYLGIV